MLISCDKDSILGEVKATVSVVARDMGDDYARIAITSRDADTIGPVYDTALARLARVFRSIGSNVETGGLEIDIQDSDDTALTTLVPDYLTNYIIGYWLRIKSIDSHIQFLGDCENILNDIRKLVYTRNKPSLKKYGEGDAATYKIIVGDIIAGRKSIPVSLQLEYNGLKNDIQLLTAKYGCGLSLYAWINNDEIYVDYKGGIIGGFDCKIGDTIKIELKKGGEILDVKEIKVLK